MFIVCANEMKINGIQSDWIKRSVLMVGKDAQFTLRVKANHVITKNWFDLVFLGVLAILTIGKIV